MSKIIALFIGVFLSLMTVHAQQRTVTGKVVNEQGQPLENVTVQVKGTTTGTVTDASGNYSINIPTNGRILIFSSIGTTTQEIRLGPGDDVNVTLAGVSQSLSEVVVVGYGQQSTRRLTTAVGKVSGEEIKNLPVANFAQALQGRIAGVQVQQGSGRPGAPIAVNIRGRSSIQAGNNPLYVIDGLILASNNDFRPSLTGAINSQLSAGAGVSPLANINPDDIESIEVLKDAAAAAIYGSRGSNGVVLITTKRGARSNRSSINFSTYYGWQDLTARRQLLNASEYRQLYNEARVNTGLTPLFTQDQINNPPANVNWVDEIVNESSAIKNGQLSITSGGDRRTQIYASLNYMQQDGPLKKGDFSRYSGRFNMDHSVTEKFRFGNSSALSRTERNETAVDNSIFSPFPRAQIARPDQPIYNAKDTFAVNDFNNPVQMFLPDNFVNILSITNLLYGELTVLPGLKFRSSLGADYTVLDQRTYDPITSLSGASANGNASSGAVTTQNYVLTQNLNYSKNLFNNRLALDATAVYEYQTNKREEIRVDGRNFGSDNTPYLVSAAVISAGSANLTEYGLASVLGRVNLAWQNKYLLGASIRRDGSSKFPTEGRYGVFPAFSLGWNLSQEDFLNDLAFISLLKLRGSYGETGNQEGILNFASRRLFGTGANYNDQPGFALATFGNPNLKWETTQQVDVGVDFNMFKDRIRMTADYYQKNTKDLLINRPIPQTSGLLTITENIGAIEGKGWDFSLSADILNKGLQWTSTLNISTYDNKVKTLYNNQPIPGTFATQIGVGQPLGAFFLIKALGVDPATGDMKYEDVNGDGIIGGLDRQYLGSPLPEYQGGWTNNLSFKGFDLSAFFQFAVGNKIYNNAAEGTGGWASLGANVSASAPATNIFKEVFDNRWTATNKEGAKYPRAVGGTRGAFNTQRSSRYLEDGSYGRLKNLILGYTLPNTVGKRIGFSNARFYVSGQNLFTITNYSGYDPEVSTDFTVLNAGVDQGAIPQMRTVTVGLSVNF